MDNATGAFLYSNDANSVPLAVSTYSHDRLIGIPSWQIRGHRGVLRYDGGTDGVESLRGLVRLLFPVGCDDPWLTGQRQTAAVTCHPLARISRTLVGHTLGLGSPVTAMCGSGGGTHVPGSAICKTILLLP